MKCDELKTETIVPQGTTITLQMYPKGEVDAAIAELKDENQRLKKKMDDYHLMSDIRRVKIKELKRALWLARAWGANQRTKYLDLFLTGRAHAIRKYKWIKITSKCRAKAEEYK